LFAEPWRRGSSAAARRVSARAWTGAAGRDFGFDESVAFEADLALALIGGLKDLADLALAAVFVDLADFPPAAAFFNAAFATTEPRS
jgi:hypothetical protein